MTKVVTRALVLISLFCVSLHCFAKDEEDLKLEQEKTQALLVVQRWQLAHQNKDAKELAALYATQVDYFHKMIPRGMVVTDKEKFFSSDKRKFISQEIVSTIIINVDGNNTDDGGGDDSLRAEFVKQVNVNNRVQNYPASLYIKENTSGQLQIIGETDDITDNNLGFDDDSRTVIKGMFDGKQKQYAWVNVRNAQTGGNCEYGDECNCSLWSGDAAVKPVTLHDCNSVSLGVIPGLDNSGRERLTLLDWREMGGYTGIHLYDIQHGQWTQAMEIVGTHVNQLEDQKEPLVAPEPGKPGFVRVLGMIFNDDTQEQEEQVKVLPLIVLPE